VNRQVHSRDKSLTETIVTAHPTLLINGRRIKASPGDTLLDAGLANRIVIPHDCCTGQCSTCRVRVYDGDVDDEGTREGDTVLACQATVSGNAVIEFDEVRCRPGARARSRPSKASRPTSSRWRSPCRSR